MKRAYAIGCIVLLAMALVLSMAVAQEIESRLKGTGEKIKLDKSGSGWKVGDTDRKVKLERSGSGARVKGTDVELEPDRDTGWAVEEAKDKADAAREKAEDIKDRLNR
jgi:hypothetical protein